MKLGDGFLSIFKTRAIVLKNKDFKENDRLIWLFTEKLGKISVVVQGAKKAKSKNMSLSLPFCFGEFVLFKGKSMYTLNEGEIEDSFQSLLNDLDTLTYASYLNELIEISMIEEENNRELFKDLIVTYYLIKNKVGDLESLIRAFEVKLLKHTGYGLNLDACCQCGKKINTGNLISTQYYGVICSDCNKDSAYTLTAAALNTLKYLVKIPLENVYKITISKEVKKELESLLSIFISQSYSKKPNSLEFIKLLRSDKNE
jgi:DNA repair protein RecO (recombination protein O)